MKSRETTANGARKRLRPGVLQKMAHDTGINYKTIESWRSRLKSGEVMYGESDPPGSHRSLGRKLLPDIEREIAEHLENTLSTKKEFAHVMSS